ncbi:MAG TPA: histidinol dehydrogenase [Candidatus Methylacidiphilales bacterium]
MSKARIGTGIDAIPFRLLDTRNPKDAAAVRALNRFAEPERSLSLAVAEIISRVRAEGDAGLINLTRKFDNVLLTPKTLRLSGPAPKVSPQVAKLVAYALKNIVSFSKGGIPKNRTLRNQEGARVGEVYHAFRRVGIYVPGGTAPLVSTALMTVGIAKAAGVKEIVVCTPPPVDRHLHYALRAAGATEIYQVGGAHAVAALAYGTKSIARVEKIFGPGNGFVVEAKRQVIGAVAVDLLPGPSEIAVVAEEPARADFIAADLLAQAEHGSHSRIVFFTPSDKLLAGVVAAIERQLPSLPRRNFLDAVLARNALFVRTQSLAEAVALSESYAPEHLSLFVKKAAAIASQIRNAGAVFIGEHSPVAAGDYLSGPSHTLPTGGAGKSFAGLTIDQFFKRVSHVEYTKASIRKAAPLIAALARLEQLEAHARSAEVRR